MERAAAAVRNPPDEPAGTAGRMDVFRKLTGLRLQDIYNLMLKKGWTLGSPQLTVGMHVVIRLFHRQQVRHAGRISGARAGPDMVVSLVPNFNRAIGREPAPRALPGTPLVTILTDLADYPPHFWIERQPQYFICGSDTRRGAGARHGPRAGARCSAPPA